PAAARSGHPGVPGGLRPDSELYLRPFRPAVPWPLRTVHRWDRAVPDDPVPLRVAVRARSDGPARRTAAAGSLGRLEPRAVHDRQPVARIGLGEAGHLTSLVRAC